MPVTKQEVSDRKRPHPTTQQMAGAFLQFDLESEIAQMRREQGWNDGHIAKTLVKQDDFRVVLIALNPDGRLPEHKTSGRFSVQTLAGHVRMHALGRTFDLPAGSLMSLDREVPHDVVALEESAILVTIAWRGEKAAERVELQKEGWRTSSGRNQGPDTDDAHEPDS